MNIRTDIRLPIPSRIKRYKIPVQQFVRKHEPCALAIVLSIVSVCFFILYLSNGLGLAYNDARSHLDIGRRVVEGLKPGLAQLGSVWLPLNHILMIPAIWNDWMWHSGFSGAIQSMVSFVVTAMLIHRLLQRLGVRLLGRLLGIVVFAANINILYLQSTAMTELLLLSTMMLGVYELILWHKDHTILRLVRSAFWIMTSTLVRYDGWFLLGYAACLVFLEVVRKHGYRKAEGMTILFVTLAAFGVFLWIMWNLLIFKDPLYFALGPFSAHSQQSQMEAAGALDTKHNWLLSSKVFLIALLYNHYTYPVILAGLGFILLMSDKRFTLSIKLAATSLLAPLIFNILALYLGFSVLFVQGYFGGTWFNVRYGIMLAPAVAFFCGYLVDRLVHVRWVIIGTLALVLFFAFVNQDAVTIDDARVGSSQKNVSEVSGYLHEHASHTKGFILISAASHDAIIFSSGLPMIRFIHEGTGKYWESATTSPDRWARWIVMRTYDDNDLTWKAVSESTGFAAYTRVAEYPFADVYELKSEYLPYVNTEPVYGKQK